MHSCNRNGSHINITVPTAVHNRSNMTAVLQETKRKGPILVGTNSVAIVVIGIFMHAKGIDRATLYLIKHSASYNYNTLTIRSIFKSMFLFNFYLEQVTTSGSAVHFEWSSPLKMWYIGETDWGGSILLVQTEEVAALGVALEVLGDEHSHVPQQTQVGLWRDKSTLTALTKIFVTQCCPPVVSRVSWAEFFDRETVDDVSPPYESSLQISAACRPPPHDLRVQFWWMGKLVNFVNEQPLTGNIHGLEFKPTSAEPPVTDPCWSISLRTLKLCFQPKRWGWSCFSFPFLFPSA